MESAFRRPGGEPDLAASGERPVERRNSGFGLVPRRPEPLAAMDVFGVPINVAPFEAVRDWFFVGARTRGRRPMVVHFAGARSVGRAWSDVAHRSRLARGDLVLAEGSCLAAYGALAAASATRFDAVATVSRLFAAADPIEPVRLFLLGGERGRAERAAKALEARFPGVRVVGAGPALTTEDVNEACADLLLVGGPEADVWVDENVELLDVGVVASVGDAIDALGGDGRRAPRATRPMGPLSALAFLIRATLYLALRVHPSLQGPHENG